MENQDAIMGNCYNEQAFNNKCDNRASVHLCLCVVYASIYLLRLATNKISNQANKQAAIAILCANVRTHAIYFP